MTAQAGSRTVTVVKESAVGFRSMKAGILSLGLAPGQHHPALQEGEGMSALRLPGVETGEGHGH
jgi:hypothetical protein